MLHMGYGDEIKVWSFTAPHHAQLDLALLFLEASGKGQDQVTKIVRVARDSPPAGGEENTAVRFAVLRVVGAADKRGWSTPDCRLAILRVL